MHTNGNCLTKWFITIAVPEIEYSYIPESFHSLVRPYRFWSDKHILVKKQLTILLFKGAAIRSYITLKETEPAADEGSVDIPVTEILKHPTLVKNYDFVAMLLLDGLLSYFFGQTFSEEFTILLKEMNIEEGRYHVAIIAASTSVCISIVAIRIIAFVASRYDLDAQNQTRRAAVGSHDTTVISAGAVRLAIYFAASVAIAFATACITLGTTTVATILMTVTAEDSKVSLYTINAAGRWIIFIVDAVIFVSVSTAFTTTSCATMLATTLPTSTLIRDSISIITAAFFIMGGLTTGIGNITIVVASIFATVYAAITIATAAIVFFTPKK